MNSRFIKKKKIVVTVFFICGVVTFFSRCINGSVSKTADVRGEAYAGSLSCMQCHKDIYTNYEHTAHYGTTQPFSDSLLVSSTENHFAFNDTMHVSVERRNNSMYQVAYLNRKEALAKPFDLTFGSGKHAYSFAYWADKKLYQLPLSYFTSAQGWANSPGFPADQAFFNRPIVGRCFECHSSYIEEDATQTESLTAIKNLNKQTIIYGIDCERCHGPAANHVNYHMQNPAVKEAKYVTGWKSLSRQQKLDVCAVCHSGNDISTQQSTFSFQPGDTLSNYYFPSFSTGTSKPDVHGKQVQLLAASRCFKMSKEMECTSCHSPHQDVPVNKSLSAVSCVTCHQKDGHINCKLATSLGDALVTNCVDCHMPYETSKAISFQTTGKTELNHYLLRTHRIAIYPEESQKILHKLKAAGN